MPYGTLDRTATSATTVGGSVQANKTGRLWEHANSALVGASIDRSDFSFRSSSELGFVYPDLSVGPNAAVPGTGIGPLRTLGNLGYAPVDLTGENTYLGLYASDTFEITERLSLSFGGRLNMARIATEDAAAPRRSSTARMPSPGSIRSSARATSFCPM